MAVISPDLDLGRAVLGDEPEAQASAPPVTRPSFAEAYEQLFDFVWRSLRRLGVPAASLDDAAQEVFLVVHRRLGEFEGRSSLKTWVYGITVRVAHDQHRHVRRKGGHEPLDARLPDEAPGPAERMAQAEAVRELSRLLEGMGPEKSEVFVLAEVEGMTAPEIAEALSIPANTVYSRLRAARREIEAALAAAGGRR